MKTAQRIINNQNPFTGEKSPIQSGEIIKTVRRAELSTGDFYLDQMDNGDYVLSVFRDRSNFIKRQIILITKNKQEAFKIFKKIAGE